MGALLDLLLTVIDTDINYVLCTLLLPKKLIKRNIVNGKLINIFINFMLINKCRKYFRLPFEN